MGLDFIFWIAILILSVIIHEVSHGYAAYIQGDPTAYYQGRLSANPMKHLDFVGSFLVPLISYTLGGFIIGWAKPVPYNPYNLKNHRWGEALVAIAGPFSNLLIAVIFGLIIRLGAGSLPVSFINIAGIVVFINVLLAIFNLVPIPPLDGSKILFSLIPGKNYSVRVFLEKNALILIIIFIFFLWRYLLPVVTFLSYLITGPNL
jgi:Zn-dependent protease